MGKPPPGVHWVEVYDENRGTEHEPEWQFDLHHPPECSERVSTSGVCDAHQSEGAPQRRFASVNDEGQALRVMAGWCEDCAVAGPKVIESHCGFQYEADAIGAEDWIADLAALRGHPLGCWCGLDDPCHVDVLLDIANQEPS